MAYARLDPAAIGSVITYLEMHEAPTAPTRLPDPRLLMHRWDRPRLADYRDLFREVGRHWLWFERLAESDDELRRVIHNPAVEIYEVRDAGDARAGMIELDFRDPGECKVAYIGLVPSLIGRGHGRELLDWAIRAAWRGDIRRLHLNTCSLDHPSALRAYLRAGFKVSGRAIGTFFDPRLRGLLPRDSAPHIPIVEGAVLPTGSHAATDNPASTPSGAKLAHRRSAARFKNGSAKDKRA